MSETKSQRREYLRIRTPVNGSAAAMPSTKVGPIFHANNRWDTMNA